MGGWMDVRARLRIASSNEKHYLGEGFCITKILFSYLTRNTRDTWNTRNTCNTQHNRLLFTDKFAFSSGTNYRRRRRQFSSRTSYRRYWLTKYRLAKYRFLRDSKNHECKQKHCIGFHENIQSETFHRFKWKHTIGTVHRDHSYM